MAARHSAVSLLAVGVISLLVNPAGSQDIPVPIVTVRVVDEDGSRVEGAEARVMHLNHPGLPYSSIDSTWTSGVDGIIRLEVRGSGEHLMVVRGPATNHAWTTRVITAPVEEPIDVVLSRGREVALQVESAEGPLPESLIPIVFDVNSDPLAFATWSTCTTGTAENAGKPNERWMIASRPVSHGKGTYTVRIPAGLKAFSVLVDHPGFIRFYEHGPIITAELADAPVKISLPQTATIKVSLHPGSDHPAVYEGCGLELKIRPRSVNAFLPYGYHRSATNTLDVSFKHLAPGIGYLVTGFTGTGSHADKSKYKSSRRPKLEPGVTEQVHIPLYSFDESYWKKKSRGSIALDVRVVRQNGDPAVGAAYAVQRYIMELEKAIVLAEGVIPEDGVVHIEGVAESSLGIFVDDRFIQPITVEAGEETSVHEIKLPPKKENPAPDFEMTNLADGSTFRLLDLKGQVVLLEFWASWCGPCQGPMKHNNELMERRRDSWKDRAVIVGVSIDRDLETIRKHVEKRKWHSVRQTWVSAETNAEVSKAYGVTGVPTAFLIDRDGSIVWSGHPGELKVEQRIDEMLGTK